MTEPLALVVYEKLLPGSQLVNRLQDLKYRVQSLNDPQGLVETAEEQKPMLLIVDLDFRQGDVNGAILKLRQNPSTAHIPVLAFSAKELSSEPSGSSGVTLVVSEAAILNHLQQCLERVLQLD